jgi:hypothetical protein
MCVSPLMRHAWCLWPCHGDGRINTCLCLIGQDLDDRDLHQASHGVQINVQDGAVVLDAAGQDSAPTMSHLSMLVWTGSGWPWLSSSISRCANKRARWSCCAQRGWKGFGSDNVQPRSMAGFLRRMVDVYPGRPSHRSSAAMHLL